MDQTPSLLIFIIEDDPDASENLRDILELDGHRIVVSHNASAAFNSPELRLSDVVLLDWKLPDGSARDVLPRLADAAPRADVLIVTGYGDFDRAVSALREGAADYLLKPINPEILRASIRRLAHRRWLSREKARSDEKFRSLVEAAPCAILILRRDLSVIYFSPYAGRITGFTESEVISRPIGQTLLASHAADTIENAAEQLFEREEVEGQEVQVTCRDGARRWFRWNARILKDVDGASAILAVGQDITEQKWATERLVQSERLSAIGEAMTGLAHESRNALQRSQAYLEMLAAQLEGQTESLTLVGQIQRAQNHLHQLYEEVRQYAAPLRVDPEPCSIDLLIEETWGNLSHLRHGRTAAIIYDSGAQDRVWNVDRFMMQQVFRNILENSLAACGDPLRVMVDCTCEEDGQPAERLRVTLRDNGPGLTPEQRARIFDPFYTTKTRGTGLGMTLAKRIVEAHGGTIRVGDGPGTEIVIELPSSPA